MPGRIPKEVSRQREERAWSLRQRGLTEAEIAAELRVSQQAVSKMLARVAARVLEQLKDQVEQLKAQQTAQLDHIVSQALHAWERSLADEETVRTVITPPQAPVVIQTVKGQSGNPALLARALQALADQRRIWGIEAAPKASVPQPLIDDGDDYEIDLSDADPPDPAQSGEPEAT